MSFSRRRRSLLAAVALGFGTVLTGGVARAAGETITVWWNQGFYPAEDEAFRVTIADWEKATGNKINLTFYNGSDLPSKIIAALTTGDVPDICYVDNGDFLLVPQAAWNDQLTDVSDVVDTQKAEYSQTALTAARLYNNVTHKRSDYGVPLKQQAMHFSVWRPMVEQAGLQGATSQRIGTRTSSSSRPCSRSCAPRASASIGLGYSLATKDSDSTYLFNQFLVAYGGGGIVTPDGKLHVDDPNDPQGCGRRARPR